MSFKYFHSVNAVNAKSFNFLHSDHFFCIQKVKIKNLILWYNSCRFINPSSFFLNFMLCDMWKVITFQVSSCGKWTLFAMWYVVSSHFPPMICEKWIQNHKYICEINAKINTISWGESRGYLLGIWASINL